MENHGDVAGDGVEAVLEPQAQVLERVEDAVRAGEVSVVVARGEAQRIGLDPGNRSRLLAGSGALEVQLRFHAQRNESVMSFLEAARGGHRRGERHSRFGGGRRIEEEGEGAERG